MRIVEHVCNAPQWDVSRPIMPTRIGPFLDPRFGSARWSAARSASRLATVLETLPEGDGTPSRALTSHTAAIFVSAGGQQSRIGREGQRVDLVLVESERRQFLARLAFPNLDLVIPLLPAPRGTGQARPPAPKSTAFVGRLCPSKYEVAFPSFKS